MQKKTLLSAMVGASLLTMSGSLFAQAPVINLSDNELATKVANLERVVQSRTRSQQRFQEQINDLQTELSGIRGKIEEQNFQIEKILQRQRELLLAFDIQSQQLQEATSKSSNDIGADSLVSGQSANSSAATQQINVSTLTPKSGSVQTEAEAYRAAVDLILKQRDTKAAIPKLEAFAAEFPDSTFKPNAHYWLGQIHYNNRTWPKAKEQFGILVSQYPDSNKTADATLKLGITEKNLGNTTAARNLFSKVVSVYANSTSAKLAQEQLNLLQ